MAFVVIVLLGVVVVASQLTAQPAPAGTGILTIGSASHAFTATTCFVSDDDFIVAGTGLDDADDRFWLSASSANFDVAVGVEQAGDTPPTDKPWLASTDTIRWRHDGPDVSAATLLGDRRIASTTPIDGTIELRCTRT